MNECDEFLNLSLEGVKEECVLAEVLPSLCRIVRYRQTPEGTLHHNPAATATCQHVSHVKGTPSTCGGTSWTPSAASMASLLGVTNLSR